MISYNHLGIKAYELKDFRAAEEWWFKALNYDPNNEDVNANIRKLYDAIGNKDQRLQEWKSGGEGRVGEANPTAPSPDDALKANYKQAQSYLQVGETAMQSEDYKTARDNLQKVVELSSGTDLARRALEDLNTINLKQTQGSQYLQ